jgi:hypothetical protein
VCYTLRMSDTHPTKAIKKKWGDCPPGTLRGPMRLPVSYNINAYEGNKKLSDANKGVLRARAHNPKPSASLPA